MAEQKKGPDEVFNENLDQIIAGIKKMEAIGVTKDVAAKLAVELWEGSKHEHREQQDRAGGLRPLGGSEPIGPDRRRDDQAGRFPKNRDDDENEEAGPTGETEGRMAEQIHGDKTETAGGRSDNTNPGAGSPLAGKAQPGQPQEPTTTAPPKTEPGTGPKAQKHGR